MNSSRDLVFIASTFILMLSVVMSTAGQDNHVQQKAIQEPENSNRIVIPKISKEIELDGRIEEPVWQEARLLPLTFNL